MSLGCLIDTFVPKLINIVSIRKKFYSLAIFKIAIFSFSLNDAVKFRSFEKFSSKNIAGNT